MTFTESTIYDHELLPCPLCGKQPRMFFGVALNIIKCDCGLNTFEDADTDKVTVLIKKWNNRV